MLRHPFVPSLTLACALAAGCAGTPALPPGAQAPCAPHPGTIAVHHAWNGSTQTLRAQDVPASVVFRCADGRGEPSERARAAWCVPVVEIESVSVDAAGARLRRPTPSGSKAPHTGPATASSTIRG